MAAVYQRADDELIQRGGRQFYEASVRYADGSMHEVVFHKAVYHAEAEGLSGIVGVMLDITERKRAEAAIRRMALTDELTGLSNRASLTNRLDGAFIRAERQRRLVGLMLLDLDAFKPVNDQYGHPVGDEVLKIVATRIRQSVRRVDMVARLGGDEFAVVLEGLESPDRARRVADLLIHEISQEMEVDGHRITVGASVGVSFYPDDANNQDKLVRAADAALYAAKKAGKGRSCFSASMEP